MSKIGWPCRRFGRIRTTSLSSSAVGKTLAAALISASCVLLTACSSNLILSSGPPPRIEDCMLIQQATPTRYVCDGKTYTAVQLTAMRAGKADVR